jgi:hypothetical protein
MKISRNSWLVRFAYFNDFVPRKTDLCSLFWRTVFMTLVTTVGLMLVGILAYVFYKEPLAIPVVVGGVAGGVTLFWGFAVGANKLIRSEVIKSIKENYCPVIEVE